MALQVGVQSLVRRRAVTALAAAAKVPPQPCPANNRQDDGTRDGDDHDESRHTSPATSG